MNTPAALTSKKSNGVRFLIIGLAGIGVLIPALTIFYPEYKRDQLIKNGIPAEAKILAVEDTGNRLNDQPEVRLELEVYPQNSPAYQTKTEMYISPVYLPQFQPGKRVILRIDKEDRMNVAVEKVKTE